MQRVWASVDLSPLSRRVAERGRIIAETHKVGLTLIHAVETPDLTLPEEMWQRMLEYRQGSAQDLYDWISTRADCPVDLEVPTGRTAEEVVKRLGEGDLLLTGTSSLDHRYVGPRTTRLVRKSPTPVLCVRRQPRVSYQRVIASVDLSQESTHAVDLAIQLAPDQERITAAVSLPSHAELVLSDAGVRQVDLDRLRHQRLDILKDQTDQFVEQWNGQVVPQVLDGPPEESVAELAHRRRADLVVISNRGAGGSPMVLLGSVGEKMISMVHCDVAVARVPGTFRRP